jgi:hypothetical protein
MATPAPDAVKGLVDAWDMTEMSDISDRVPSLADRRVFLSADYKEEQLRAEFLNGPCLTIRHSDFVIRTFSGPFFTALGWDMDNAIDTIRTRNWGSAPLFSKHQSRAGHDRMVGLVETMMTADSSRLAAFGVEHDEATREAVRSGKP